MTTPRSKWAEEQRRKNAAAECTQLMRVVVALAEFQPSPAKTTWGEGMMVADIALNKDEIVSVYVHKDDIYKIKCPA